MLRNIPVLLEGYRLMVLEEPELKTRRNDATGEVETVTDWQGAPQYVISVHAKPRKTADGRPAGKGAEIKVTLETEPTEEISDGSIVELINPRVSHWETELNGRTMSGLAWKATGVKLA
ncbi:hypothetical protein GCM10011581_31890 [Saccharopolyspora subtropica]|uniref:Uncharacterized protein n=1 Tax=Saccharopolyspora thermophila TaxID=89367 RepID=A0A917K0N7_9PSEU|nr:hypothetical protein [Saccharopolyspora subtropica]GGI92361.1 hypothetical protein GCM10011581_31890 [Saccharopolyspora subtropica]